MSLADELLKIEELHNRGSLSDAEFQQAKAALLASDSKTSESVELHNITEQITELQQQAKLVQIDRAWETERQRFMIHTKYGYQIPTRGTAIGSIVGCALFVVFGAVISFASLGARHSGFNGIGLILVLPGIIGIVFSLSLLQQAKNYEAAHRFYQQRRSRTFKEAPVADATQIGQLVPNIITEPAKENLFTHLDKLQPEAPSPAIENLDEQESKIFN